MKKTIISLSLLISLSSCADLQHVVNQIPTNTTNGISLTNADIAAGLREALNLGIEKQVSNLTQTDGFYKNELVKIVLPEELQQVDKALRKIGLGNLADEGIKALNRAAEDAVKEATPIFVDAVKGITFNDAKAILLGNNTAATDYLTAKTETQLYTKFNPVIQQSFSKVGADKIWNTLITKYNNIPFTTKVNPDLTDYVTDEALEGVYTMIAVEEQTIRESVSERSTELLKRVFALQD
ncbi:DUF4197 domain-containing protein [Formosa sp. S-31]|uniref:DUF4197 domain-containing protein n=1 Tax=Formosa sp. S-31 TaxID=2790949 RepID=UPI003EBE9BA7